jgi:hypothetical protein
VALADQSATVTGEKLVVAKIQRDREVLALILVGNQLAVEVGDEPFPPIQSTTELEFEGGAFRHLSHPGNLLSAHDQRLRAATQPAKVKAARS